MNKYIYIATIFSSVIVSCNNQEDCIITKSSISSSIIKASISIDALTRVTIGESDGIHTPLLWENEDHVFVYNVSSQTYGQYEAEESSQQSIFSLVAGSELIEDEKHVAIYPYENVVPTCLCFRFPSIQCYNEGSFDRTAMPLLSFNNEGNVFEFIPQASLLRLRLSTTESDAIVKRISIKSASSYLSGMASIEFDDNNYIASIAGDEAVNYVSLSCPDINICTQPTDFYIVVPSQTYSAEDLTIIVNTDKGDIVKSSKKEADFMPGVIYNINVIGEPVMTVAQWDEELILGHDNASKIVIETSALDKPSTAHDLNLEGSLWEYYENTTLYIQTFERIISGHDTWNHYNMYNVGLFSGYKLVESINGLQNIDLSKVSNLLGMFANCKSLTNLDLSSFITSCATNMGKMFYNCESLEALYLSNNFSMSKVKEKAGMFENCGKLVDDKGTVFGVTDSDIINALSTETNFDFMKININNAQWVYSLELGRDNAETIILETAVDVSAYNEDYYHHSLNSDGTLWEVLDGNTLHIQTNEALITAKESDHEMNCSLGLFSSYSLVKYIYGLENLDISNTNDISFMFSFCPELISLDLSSFDTQNVTDMSSMFKYCYNLKMVDLSSFNTLNVQDTRNMFENCFLLESLILSDDFNMDSVIRKDDMFESCGKSVSGMGIIYGVNDAALKSALSTGTDFNWMKFFEE